MSASSTTTAPAASAGSPIFADTRLTIEARDLTIDREWPSGGKHRTNLIENNDLTVILNRGDSEGHVAGDGAEGTVVIRLGVDGDSWDNVFFEWRGGAIDNTEELLARACEALETCLAATRRVGS
jgi:hypothetical protein